MALTIEATYENGVFVPARQVGLAEHERVRLVIEPLSGRPVPGLRPDPFRNHKRIQIDPRLAREIASLPEFLPEEA